MGVPRSSRKITNNSTSLSCCKYGEKRVRKRSKTTIRSLPKELLVEVLARVASSSFDYLFDVKLICKEFMEAAEDDYIWEHISINKFPVTQWFPVNDKRVTFLTQCFNKGNSEALFRRGMIEYFKLAKVESGLGYFKRAVEKEHSEATYVYGMLLLAQGDDQSSQHGLNILNFMKCSKQQNWNVEDCRDRIESILSELWINNPINLEKVITKCKKQDHAIRFRRRGWRFDEDEELSSCETCAWYRELVYFGKIMNLIV